MSTTVIDFITNQSSPYSLVCDVLELIYENKIHYLDLVLVKAPDNNDSDGSAQHPYPVNFGYNSATEDDFALASTIGVYDYFGLRDSSSDTYSSEGAYTGNQYERDPNSSFTRALVLDPPAYTL